MEAVVESDVNYVVNLWRSILGVELIEMHDNFYTIGGNSMLAVKMLAKVVRDLDCELHLDLFFDTPTLQSLCLSILRTAPK